MMIGSTARLVPMNNPASVLSGTVRATSGGARTTNVLINIQFALDTQNAWTNQMKALTCVQSGHVWMISLNVKIIGALV